MVDTAAKSIPDHYNHVALDCHIVMPNHIHLLLSLYERPDANVAPLGVVIGTFKAQVTREVNRIDSAFGRIWQSRYHDHIVRSPDELERIRAYIRFNPVNWQDDTFFVDYT
ncbi:MAG: transposase [Chloroflexi bacterium]|nr:transposase [Chloroflexota bacterium]